MDGSSSSSVPSAARPLRILAIDQGEIHFGLCLAEYDGRIVTPLFLGTAYLEPKPLGALVEKRAARRRVRRTAREHHRRLKRLRDLLGGRGGPLYGQPALIHAVAAFAKRRGHFYGEDEDDEGAAERGEAVPHAEFTKALAEFLATLIPDSACRASIERICASVLDRKSRRPMRVDVRTVGVCQWEGCTSRRTSAGVGSLIQGLSGKLRPFLEAKALTPATVEAIARAAVDDEHVGPTALIRRLDMALADALGLPPKVDAKGRPLPSEKSLEAWLMELDVAVPGEAFALAAARRQKAKLLARWYRPKRKESIRPGVFRDLERAGGDGRSRFCPKHQAEYVTTFLQGEPWPQRTDSQEVSRRLSILADKLTTYLTRRVLGDPARAVDQLVIESSAFDALRMLRPRTPPDGAKKPHRLTAAEEGRLYELYWEGPRAGYADTKTMLRTEFGGLCAYCGRPLGDTFEEDHVLPRQRFPMEGYLVRVPACTACNRTKGTRSLLSWGVGIHPEALKAFTESVSARKAAKTGAIHPVIDAKKGLLQNLAREKLAERLARYGGDLQRAERSLHEMAGSWMLRTTASARHGRFLRQALAARLDIPATQTHVVSGRHTALLRDALTDAWDYDKTVAKAAGDQVDNHALDAYVLALGTLTGCFARLAIAERFNRETEDVLTQTVACADPAFRTLKRFRLDCLPVRGAEALTPSMGVVGGPEADRGVNLVTLRPSGPQYSCFDTTLYALTGPYHDEPARRKRVGDFFDNLRGKRKAEEGRDLLDRLTHLTLRARVLAAWDTGGVEAVGAALVAWYKATAKGYDRPGNTVRHTSHPTILARWAGIQAFLDNPAATVADIPREFSLRVKQEGRGAPTPLRRGKHEHQRLAAGGVVAKVVGYRRGPDGQVDRTRPIVVSVQPDWSVKVESGGRYRDLPALPRGLTTPLAHDGTPFESRRRTKHQAVEAWLREAGCAERHWLRAGSTIRHTDGAREFVRTHKDPPPARYVGITQTTAGLPRA
ncbi:MAG: hypothetical protein HY712_04375 [candidate division NC10 bacterium]|nr:hypothetical protein [candidate division NC10 bacterium]